MVTDKHGIHHQEDCDAVHVRSPFTFHRARAVFLTGRKCTCGAMERTAAEALAKTKCPCGSTEFRFTLTLVESAEDYSMGPRTMTAHLCKGCGTVAFDMLAEAGFLSLAKAFAPGPAEIGKNRPSPRFTARLCGFVPVAGEPRLCLRAQWAAGPHRTY